MPVTTLTSKGQVTIPKVVRKSLCLNVGDKIEFIVTENKEVILRPITKKVDEVFGSLHKPGRKVVSIDDMDAAIKQKVRTKFQ